MEQVLVNNNMAFKPAQTMEKPRPAFVPPAVDNSPEKPKMPSTPEYLAQLLSDKNHIDKVIPNVFIHVGRLLEEEINRVRKSLYSIGGEKDKQPLVLPESKGPKVAKQEKLFIPVKAYPNFNFVGRILGPRGMTAKQFEEETGCKIMIRGKGSMRDKAKEEQNRGKPNWEHLNEDLHVLITVEDTEDRAKSKIERAISEMKKLLVPTADGEDELKKKQLLDLALLNGTYRDPKQRPQTTLTAAPLVSREAQGHRTAPVQTPCSTTPSPLVSPRTVPPPGPALVPQPLRSPTPAAQAHLLASPFLPRVSGGPQSILANGLNGFTGALPGQATLPTPDSAGGLFYHAYDPYQLAGLAPAVLEYPGAAADGTIGPTPKLRRTQIREHPYQRAVLDARGDNLLAMMQESVLKQRSQEQKPPPSLATAWLPQV